MSTTKEEFKRPVTKSEVIATKLLDIFAEIKQEYGHLEQFEVVKTYLTKLITVMNDITLDEHGGNGEQS